MEGIYLGYLFGVLMSIFMFIPIIYGLWEKGINNIVEKTFFALLLANLSWSIVQLAQIISENTFHLIIIESIALFTTWGSIYGSFIFAIVYTKRSNWLKKEVIGISITPIILYIIFTSYTYFTAEPTVQTSPFTYLVYEMNILDWWAIVYTFILFMMSFAFFIDFYRKNNSKAAKGVPMLIFGLLVPLTLGLLSFFGDILMAPQFNHGPLGFPVFAVAITVAIYQFDILNVKPIAVDKFIQDLPNPLFILDTDKNVLDYNTSAGKFVCHGVNEGDAFDSVVPFDSTTIKDLFVGEGVNGTVIPEEISGVKHYFMVSSSVVYDGDDFLGWVVYVKDVTENEEQKKELERQNQQLERFADGIVHDIRNPLAIATQYSELYFESLMEKDEPLVTPEKAYDVIQNAHTRLDEIIDNIRWLSKFGQTIEETEPVTISSLVRDVWKSLDRSGSAKVEVLTDGTIEAEEKRLKSVFDNLFKNSLRYAGEDCHITVEVTDNSEILIRDNGPGIPDDEKDYLFDYGYTTSEEGTGFGLSLVKTVVEAHGWEIEVDDSYTGGAGFRISGVKVLETDAS